MIVYEAFDAKLVGTPLGHAAILERRNKEDKELFVVSVGWTRRADGRVAWKMAKAGSTSDRKSFPRTGPERATLGSGSGRFRRSRARPDLGRVGACVPRGRTAWTSPSPPEATRRTRARPRARSGPGSSPAGQRWHAAPCFCPCVTDDTLEKEPFCARPRVVACATATFDVERTTRTRRRTRACALCGARPVAARDAMRIARGKTKMRVRAFSLSTAGFSEIRLARSRTHDSRAVQAERKTARSSPPTRHFETRVTEAERAFPRRASSASRAR